MPFNLNKVLPLFGTLFVIWWLFLSVSIAAHGVEILQTRIAEAISLQDQMENSLMETFNDLFADYIYNSSSSFRKSFIYICNDSCINNLYGYGLTSAFLLAVLSERKFSIYPNNETQFYSYYYQNTYRWKINTTSLKNKRNHLMVPHSRNKHRSKTELFLVERAINTLDFESFFKEDIIYHYGNEDWVFDLRRHPKTAEKMPWLFLAHSSDIFRLVFNGLFQAPEVSQTIKAELRRRVGDDRLICFIGSMNDNFQLNTFLDFFTKMFNNGSKLYISGVPALYKQIRSYIPKIDKKLVEIHNKNIYEQYRLIGMRDKRVIHQLLNIEVCKVCDVLVVADNPSGVLAAQLRRDENNLYCYRNGTIFPCVRRLIARSFRDVANPPDYFDAGLFCTLSPKDCKYK